MKPKQEGGKAKADKTKAVKASNEEIKAKPTKKKSPEAKELLSLLPPPKKNSPAYNEKIDLQGALELRLKGVSYQVIADHYGCTKAAVIGRLKPYVASIEVDTEVYKRNRADIFANKQAAVLAGLTGSDLKRIIDKSPMAAVTLFNSLFNNERLERGQSTQNTAVLMASAVVDADKEESERWAKLKAKQAAPATETATESRVISAEPLETK